MRLSTTVSKLAHYLSLAIGLILILLPFHALLTTWLGSNSGHLDLIRIWKEILLTVMAPFVSYLIVKDKDLREWFTHSWLARLIYIYVLLHLALGWWAFSHHEVTEVALIYALIINLRFLGFFLICYAVAASAPWLKRNWSRLVVWPAALVVAFGLIQRLFLPVDFLKHFGYGPKTIPAYQTVDSNLDYRRIQSTLRGANPLGAYLVLIMASLLAGFKKSSFKVLLLIAAVLTLFFSYSRSAWIGAVLAIGFIGWLGLGKTIRWRWAALVSVATVVIVGGGLYLFGSSQSVQDTLLHTSSESHSSVSSNAQRSAAIKSAAKDVEHHPLGRGPGTAGPASFRNNNQPKIAEDYYLQLGQEVGIVGMLLFITINVLVALKLWRQKGQTLAQLLLASLIGISFINLLSHAWTDDTLSLLWWGLAGITLAPVILTSKEIRDGRIQKKP